MATVTQFEELIVWKKARRLAKEVFLATGQPSLRRQFALADQMRRAGVSIISNIAEGFERKSPRDFAHFLRYAKASCAELRSQLYLAYDIGGLTTEDLARLSGMTLEVGRLIGGLQSYLHRVQRTR
jgi:four helix bundle protein